MTLAFLYACYSLIMEGRTIEGTIVGVTDVVTLAGVFIYGTKARKQERLEKRR